MSTLSARESLELIQLISGVNRRLEQAVEARLKPAGIPIEQYRILASLSWHDGRAMGELAAEIFVDSPTLTKIVDRMVANADVFRAPDPRDRRKVLIFLSEKGRAAIAALRALVEAPEIDLVGPLARGDAEQLRALLESLLPN